VKKPTAEKGAPKKKKALEAARLQVPAWGFKGRVEKLSSRGKRKRQSRPAITSCRRLKQRRGGSDSFPISFKKAGKI